MKKTIEDINAIRKAMQPEIILRDNSDAEKEIHIIVGMGTTGISAGAREVFNALVDEVESRELHGVRVTRTGSMADKGTEPVIEVHVPGEEAKVYGNVDAEKAVALIAELSRR